MTAETQARGARREIIEAQRWWAATSGIETNDQLRTLRLTDNLYQPLHPKTRSEFGAGAGGELGTPMIPGKLASLYSSAALACNLFDFWRDKDTTPLTSALGLEGFRQIVSFEATHPTGLQGTAPHLDLELGSAGLLPVAIESKFTEPYGTVHNQFGSSYFKKPDLWFGLASSRELAYAINERVVEFRHLHAAQLIKHMLGLNHSYGPMGYELLYMWFAPGGPESERHAVEAQRFAELVASDVRFRALTYQDLLARIEVSDSCSDWHHYLANRYLRSE